MSQNQEKFCKAVLDVRNAWSLKTSTFEEICHLIGNAICIGTNKDIDQNFAENTINALWLEWTQFRASYFMFKSPNEIFAKILRWGNGKHYYVKIHGKNVLIEQKFNRIQDAESFLKNEVKKLEEKGNKVILFP